MFKRLRLKQDPNNGIDLNFLVANNPTHQRFQTDVDAAERDTLFGTVRRNLDEEIKAMQAGLAPGQVRAGLRVLLQGIKASRSQSGDLRLAGVQPNVLKVLNLSGFTHILKLFDELDAAVGSYS